ncbi:inovirus-type Gp2 protein [Psychrobacter sp. GP33]|uniref:YagK/YfjJ domain-containing protein n=1 Tax=Psychrobacter sp. GP33 TaxID=2758709 RepID=UPI0015FD6D53|nr:inovirus-type Gp2 protein [Psychrobacter sp. GP33]
MDNSDLNPHQVIAAVDQLVSTVFNSNIENCQITDALNECYAPFMSIYDDRLNYTCSIHAFLSVTQSLVNDLYPEDVIWDEALTVEFVHELMKFYPHYQLNKANHAQQETKNSYSLETYLQQLTTHYSRLLFVRVDLTYLVSKQKKITVWDFNHHMTILTQQISNQKSYFRGLQGYAWALEQGYESGSLHCHLLLIYDGAKRDSGWGVAKNVGKKWKKITKDQGKYFNCHDTDYISGYEASGTLGIGMIHRDNDYEVGNALRTASYLTRPTKYNQRLKRWLPNTRSFGHGQYRNTKRRGLPPITK